MPIEGHDVLRRAIAGQWRHVTAGSVLAAGHQAGEALVPVVIGLVIDEAISSGDAGTLVRWIAVLALVFAGLSLSYRFGSRAAERASEQAAHGLRVQLTERVLAPRGGAETGRLPGELVSVATQDARRVGAVAVALTAGISALTGLVVGGVVLLRVSVPLGLLILLGIPPLLLLAHLLGKPLERRSGAEQERAAHASGVAADLVAGLRVLKGIGAEAAAVARYRRTSRESLAATVRAARAQAWHDGGMLTLTGVFIAAVALVGGRLAAQGDVSVGELVTAVGLAQFLLTPLSVLSWANGEFAQGRASATRIASVLAAPPAVIGGTDAPPQPVRGRIRLSGVRHGALRGLTLDAAPGELLGVVTADPAVAASLLRVLGRAADPEAGTAELDGVPLTALDPAEIRRAVVVAEHDADLFEGSLIGNVTAAAAPGAAGPALAAAAADEVAEALPYGTATVLTERGRSLSGGQRQRVALARALATGAPVLVLHDPTTAVDAATEARIAAGIREVRDGKTTIMVTTSPALLAVTDRVMFLDGGSPVEEGTHTGLVHGNEAYRATVLA
ncbi:multidrug ABC transporter ATP-binding protein [Planobispora rosea]|uniref:Multidrug ABC transporter ATP-binding protein n=1 Tax=Planobispora rosea TaxID=35762 RepID=A0A8J3RVG7_PLARO|nr:ABC transporter ATP-binding protein [Planobispora rosea]GGS68268.1 multidrug ABC transporter ATP-binding protein [Planobispora rosea]GIH81974.1 multidrug ABC transporter ATP-binding protein [Planobispora rosea]